ncbi:MAG: histidinol-phosphate transaminase [Planctomycetota bacterium]
MPSITIRPPIKIRIALADPSVRDAIYRLRHDVYSRELGQHPANSDGKLTDALDAFNIYITATLQGKLAGFVSVTPPGGSGYSLDKYLPRMELPFTVDERTYEIRILTIPPDFRNRVLAPLLMYAAFRWIESHGGTRIIAIGRKEILDLYRKSGMKPQGRLIRSGAVTFELLTATVAEARKTVEQFGPLLTKMEQESDWNLAMPFRKPASCFHGGTFFSAIGESFDRLERRRDVINADVLDAWFPPSPRVISALQEHLPWLIRTSPPTGCDGMIRTIASVRGVPPDYILPGAGSSDLIFLAFREWLTPASRVLILDPTYGEYAHVLGNVIRCRVDRFPLDRHNRYRVDGDQLSSRLRAKYDLVVLVNPNSPTGQIIPRRDLEGILSRAPGHTRFWIDETYIEYAGRGQSLEPQAARSGNIIICKSMSKVYALSGLRAAYLCAPPHQLESLRAITPPWAVSLPAQIAAVKALADPGYYEARYAETHTLRDQLAGQLESLGMDAIPGTANFLLCHLPADGPDAESVVAGCRNHGLFLRNASTMGSNMGNHAIRIAVKDGPINDLMIGILKNVLHDPNKKPGDERDPLVTRYSTSPSHQIHEPCPLTADEE